MGFNLSPLSMRRKLLGSLSYEPRKNLSVFTSMYYRPITDENKKNCGFREVYSPPKMKS